MVLTFKEFIIYQLRKNNNKALRDRETDFSQRMGYGKGCMVKEMAFELGREERVEAGGRDGGRGADRITHSTEEAG